MPSDGDWVRSLYDEDEDDEHEKDHIDLKDACLFMIEANDAMLEAPTLQTDAEPAGPSLSLARTQPSQSTGSDVCPLLMGLKAVYQLMRRKIISAPKDMIGVLIYNTSEGSQTSGESAKWSNCIFVRDIAEVDVEAIQSMRMMIGKCEGDPEKMKRRFMAQKTEPNCLVKGLRAAASRFQSQSPKQASKRIFLLSNNDDPFPKGGSKTDMRRLHLDAARTVARDIREMGIQFETLFLERSSQRPFDQSIFWDELFDDCYGTTEGELSGRAPTLTGANQLFEAMLDAASMRESAKRALWNIPFKIAEGVEIGVSGYALVVEEKRKAYTWYDPHTRQGEEVTIITEMEEVSSTEKIAKRDIVKYYPVGDPKQLATARRVIFTAEEQTRARTLGRKPGLILLGFKPRSALLPEFQVKQSYFIYPNEETYVGSIRTFSALLRAMSREGAEKVGYGVFSPRKTSTPELVVILPQREVWDTTRQTQHSGFHLCRIPWADEIREPGISSTLGIVEESEESEAIDAAQDLIKKLKLRYTPGNYPNPALNFHYNCLAAVALKEDLPEPEDKTLPRYYALGGKRGELIRKFKQKVSEHPRADERSGDPIKISKKRKKMDGDDDGDPVEKVEEAFKFAIASKLKVAQLRDYAKAKGLLTTGAKAPLKAEIVQIVRRYLLKEGIIDDMMEE